jgi:hypothetical protein
MKSLGNDKYQASIIYDDREFSAEIDNINPSSHLRQAADSVLLQIVNEKQLAHESRRYDELQTDDVQKDNEIQNVVQDLGFDDFNFN